MNVTCVLIFDGSSLGCKSNAGQSLQKAAPNIFFKMDFTYIGKLLLFMNFEKGKNENEKSKNKKVNQENPDGVEPPNFSPPSYRLSRGKYVQAESVEAGRLQSACDSR